jgi:hypothetical protein
MSTPVARPRLVHVRSKEKETAKLVEGRLRLRDPVLMLIAVQLLVVICHMGTEGGGEEEGDVFGTIARGFLIVENLPERNCRRHERLLQGNPRVDLPLKL